VGHLANAVKSHEENLIFPTGTKKGEREMKYLRFLLYTTPSEKIAIAIVIVIFVIAVIASAFGNAAGQTLTSAISRH
jgi:hypothetical protein